MTKRILLVDDHELIRQGLRTILSGRYAICGEAANGREALEKALALRPDVVILDVSMPVMNGIEAARQIRALVPATKILILTMHNSPQMVAAAREAGADGVLTKTAPSPELLRLLEIINGASSVDSPPPADGE